MFRGIFGRLTAVFISVLIISSSIIGVILYYFLSDYILDEKVNLMEQSGNVARLTAEENLDSFNDQAFLGYFRSLLKFYNENNDFMIWMVDSNGKILVTDSNIIENSIPKTILGAMDKQSGSYYLSDGRQYSRIMMGGTDFVIEEGYFYGLFNQTGMPWLTVQIPVKYENSVIAAIYINTPIPEIQKARFSVFRMFLISTAAAVVLSIMLVYVYSRRLSKPLKEINRAAKAIAGGEFTKRLQIDTNDEIGDLAKSFNQMTENLEHLEEMRSSFIANVSHELRTPMTSIQGFIEGIIDGTITAGNQTKYLKIVRDETSRLSRLVNDLLSLSRLEAGSLKPNITEFDLNELIRLCVINLESMISQKSIQIEANFTNEKTFVKGDSDLVQRIVLNLLHNAVKYTPDYGEITLSTSIQKSKVHVSVADTGAGIAEEDIEHIWERFYKSDKSRGRDKTGTGLGLTIVKSLLNQLGQEIQVKSVPGQGSVFTFTLDLAFIIDN